MLATAVQRPGSPGLPRDLVVAGALLLAGAVTIAILPTNPDYPLEAVLVGLTAGAFALSLHSAIWVIAPLLVVEFSIKNYAFGDAASTATATSAVAATTTVATNTSGITLRLLVVVVATLLSLAILLRHGPRLWQAWPGLRVLGPAVGLILIATAFDLPREPADAATKYLRYQLTQLAALVLIACLVRQSRDLRIVLGVGLALMVVSAALAVWQFQDPVTAPFASPAITGLNQTDQTRLDDATVRAVGLSSSPIQLAGAMSVVVPFLLGVIVCGSVRPGLMRWGLCAAVVLLTLATYLTFTRAAMIAIAAGLAAIAIFLPLDRRVAIWTGLGGAALLFLLLEGTGVIGERYYQGVSEDKSAASHLALFEVGTAIAMDNPLTGIGHTQFQDVSTGYSAVVSADAHTAGTGAGTVGTDPPHDDFLLVLVSWGLPALAAYVTVFVGAVANCVYAATHARDRLTRGTAIGLVGALTGYAVSSAFHNYLDSSLLLWLGAGLSIALARLAASEPRRPRLPHPRLWSAVALRQQLARNRRFQSARSSPARAR